MNCKNTFIKEWVTKYSCLSDAVFSDFQEVQLFDESNAVIKEFVSDNSYEIWDKQVRMVCVPGGEEDFGQFLTTTASGDEVLGIIPKS